MMLTITESSSSKSHLSQVFAQLDKQLLASQHLWRFEPFLAEHDRNLAQHLLQRWQPCYPQLCRFLSELTAQEVLTWKQSPELVAKVLALLPDIDGQALLPEMTLFAPVETQAPLRQDASINAIASGVPGRKWQQISAFSQGAQQLKVGQNQWLEWCAGKGYLGRLLVSQTGQKVTSVEWQQSLCDSGQQFAEQHQLEMHFIPADVLLQDLNECFQSDCHAVALHACGDLHAKLIDHACQHKLAGVTISPCCYHLTAQQHYQPLSQLGQQSSLKLTRAELRLPLQQTVTGGKRVVGHRQLEMSYRLGFDAMLRQLHGYTQYLPLPSIRKSELSKGFEYFCQWAKQQKQLAIELDDLCHWQAQGERRFIEMERLSLVQQVFLRPLELWLVHDKALKLEQHGYQVTISQFCPRQSTPRNLLIQAKG